MGVFYISLFLTTLLCSLVAGFLFAFAIVIMPGLKELGAGDFIRSFQVMDRIIQNNQPLFMVVWVGSILAALVGVSLGISQLEGFNLVLIISATLSYFFGVQFPTVIVNIPLNKRLQSLDTTQMNESAQQKARSEFEPRWLQYNSIRTFFAILTSALLIVLIFRL